MRRVTMTLALVPSLAHACSGPGAQEAMKSIERSARWGAGASLLLVLASAGFRRWRAFGVCLALLVVHPAWTMSPYSGDCGETELGATLLVAALSLGAFGWDLLRYRRHP